MEDTIDDPVELLVIANQLKDGNSPESNFDLRSCLNPQQIKIKITLDHSPLLNRRGDCKQAIWDFVRGKLRMSEYLQSIM